MYWLLCFIQKLNVTCNYFYFIFIFIFFTWNYFLLFFIIFYFLLFFYLSINNYRYKNGFARLCSDKYTTESSSLSSSSVHITNVAMTQYQVIQ